MPTINKYASGSTVYNFIGFVGGLNTTASALDLTDSESPSLQNIDFNKFGSIKKRNGYTAVNTSALNSGARITCLHYYQLADGTKNVVVVAGSKVYYWSAASLSGAPTDITGAITVTAGNLVSSCTFRDTALFTNGVDVPFKWTGSGNCAAMTVPTNLTKAKCVETFQGYTFLANVTVGGTAYPSRIYYSNINAVGTWTDTDFVDVSYDDGQAIVAIKALGDRLAIFKDRSIHVAQFTGDADIPFLFAPTNSPVGCASQFSIQEAENGLIFLSADGIYFFDGFNSYKLSDRINTTLLTDMSPSKFGNSCSMYQHSQNRYWLGMTVSGGSTNSQVITWTHSETNQKTDAFSLYTGMAPSAMCLAFTDGITEQPLWGDYSGFVYKADTGTDDYPLNVQTAIDAYYYTNWIFFGNLVDQKAINTFILYYQYNTGNLTLSHTFDLGSGDSYSQTFSQASGGALFDSAIFDTDVFATTGGAVARRQLDGRGRTVRFKFSNSILSQTFQVDGFGMLVNQETYVG